MKRGGVRVMNAVPKESSRVTNFLNSSTAMSKIRIVQYLMSRRINSASCECECECNTHLF